MYLNVLVDVVIIVNVTVGEFKNTEKAFYPGMHEENLIYILG